jgi:fructoselysine and glucoselysine-specific PTS system IID component
MLTQGVMIGATLELIFMGNIKVGRAIPPDIITGGVLGTAFAILSHKGPAIALALAVPISILSRNGDQRAICFQGGFSIKNLPNTPMTAITKVSNGCMSFRDY